MNIKEGFEIGGYFILECVGPDGVRKWIEKSKNLVVTEGLQAVLDVYLLNGTQDTTHFIGLSDSSSSYAAGDTLASHAGWTEFDEYTGTRQAYVGVRSSQTVSNTASPASFPITGAGGGVGGAFLCGVTSGTSGVLTSGSALGADRTVASGDTVNITYTVTAAAS